MPVTAPQWTEVLYCPLCCNMYTSVHVQPISLGCGHTVCKPCLSKLHQRKCPFDQFQVTRGDDELAVNAALLFLVGDKCDVMDTLECFDLGDLEEHYLAAMECIVQLAVYLKPMFTVNKSSVRNLSPSNLTNSCNGQLSRPMQRKLVSLICCQLMEDEGVSRAMRAARSLGERTVTELILQNQNQQQLSANLWAAVRSRGCQFLGPAMQEEVLNLILLALEDGSSLSRKVLVLYVVQKLQGVFSQASKTAIGHVVQLLYRASCFKVSKREGESSLMELKEEFRTYDQLRREHDSQIVQIATEAGLRIAPDQWSSLLYGDASHKSHMQSIIDKLQTSESFSQSISELVFSLQRSKQDINTSNISRHLERLSKIDMNPDAPPTSWKMLAEALVSAKVAVDTLMSVISNHTPKKADVQAVHNAKYKTSMCRDHAKGNCPRGNQCTFAHNSEELEHFRARSKRYCTPQQPATTTITTTIATTIAKPRVEPITVEPSNSHVSQATNTPISDSEEFARNMAAAPPRMMTYELPYSSSKGRPMYPAQGYQLHHAPKGKMEQSMFQRPTTPDSALKGLQQQRNTILAKLNKSLPGDHGVDVPLHDPFNLGEVDDYPPGLSAAERVYNPWSSGYFEPPIKAVVTPVIPRMMTEPTYTTNRVRNTSAGRNRTELVDQFVPFDPPIVSKFGPIKRLKDTAKFKLTEPVQAVSSQPKPTVPVTAITPTTRPFPSPSPVPSMYTCIQGQPEDIVMDPHTGEPIPGNKIAHVVPVAQLQSTSPLSVSTPSPRQDSSRHVTSIAEREQLKLELNQVNQKIDKLSEYSLLTEELQRVERSIFETEQKQVPHADLYTGHTNLSILNDGHRFPSVADIGLDFSSRKTVNVMPNPGMYTQMPAPVPPSALSNTVYRDSAAVPRSLLSNTVYRNPDSVPPPSHA